MKLNIELILKRTAKQFSDIITLMPVPVSYNCFISEKNIRLGVITLYDDSNLKIIDTLLHNSKEYKILLSSAQEIYTLWTKLGNERPFSIDVQFGDIEMWCEIKGKKDEMQFKNEKLDFFSQIDIIHKTLQSQKDDDD